MAVLLEESMRIGMKEVEELTMMMKWDHMEEDEDLEHWHLRNLRRSYL